MNSPIDIIIPWVDGNDPQWINAKLEAAEKYNADNKINSNVRYQNWDNLQYWFRAVEKFMPWVNRIFFVTWGHVPEFLNTNHPKIKVVKHTDYIPEKYLPTFNSAVIEMNYYRIEELSENFILFNDDFFPLQPIREDYYFKNNLVCDEAIESPIIPVNKDGSYKSFCVMQFNDLTIINKHFKKREVQKKFWKWYFPGYGELLKRNIGLKYWYNFVGFRDPHLPSALKKSTLKLLWDVEPDALDKASKNHFRTEDREINHYLIRYWQLCTGDFHPRKTQGKYCAVGMNNFKEIAEGIRKQSWKMVALNEMCMAEEFEIIRKEINSAFDSILPEKSSFEK